MLIDLVEVEFLRAEANVAIISLYLLKNIAIKYSFLRGRFCCKAQTYLSQPKVAYSTAEVAGSRKLVFKNGSLYTTVL
jgi:hypothetical protein